MRTETEIKGLAKWLKDTYHSKRVTAQKEEATYYWDTFAVPHIKEPYQVLRLGRGADLVDVPVSHIITEYPKVYTLAIDNNETAINRARKRGALLNSWATALSKENPQPYRLFAKFLLSRGESWVKVVNRGDKDELSARDIPLNFPVLDPMIVFGSPDERDGVPDYVLIEYERDYLTVLNNWEYWKNPKSKKDDNRKVIWREFWDKDIRYCEADGEPVTGVDDTGKRFSEGIIPNIFGFVPFVHEYSGYGVPGIGNEPETIAVSRIRHVMGRILEETEAASYISSQLKIHSVGRVDIVSTDPNKPIPTDLEYDLNVGSKNLIPYGVVVNEHLGSEPGAAIFNHLYTIGSYIEKSSPPIMQGIGTGSSGRAEDITSKHALAQYETVVNNTANAFAKAFEIGLHICEKLNLFPLSVRGWKLDNGVKIRETTQVKLEDIDDYECEVRLKAADPIEDKAMALQGNREQQAGIIDWETNLTKYHGMSEEEAKDVMDKAIIDKIILESPVIQQVIASEAMKRLGMGDLVEQLMAAQTPQGGSPPSQPIPGQAGARGGTPREGNIQNDSVYNEADMMLQGYKQRQPARTE